MIVMLLSGTPFFRNRIKSLSENITMKDMCILNLYYITLLLHWKPQLIENKINCTCIKYPQVTVQETVPNLSHSLFLSHSLTGKKKEKKKRKKKTDIINISYLGFLLSQNSASCHLKLTSDRGQVECGWTLKASVTWLRTDRPHIQIHICFSVWWTTVFQMRAKTQWLPVLHVCTH